MFEKLLANLPYNPDLSKQVAFYARRLRHEESVRLTGLVFIVLTFLVQGFAFISPPQPKAAALPKMTSSQQNSAGITQTESAANITQNLPDAHSTTAQPNDVIVYTLAAKNRSATDVKGFVMQTNLSDVLDYADIVELDDASMHSASGVVSWQPTTIIAGAQLTHKIIVRVKSSLPTSTPPAGNPDRFDHRMTVSYGNAVTIKLPRASIALAANASQSLPNTSRSNGLLLAFALVVVGGYFFARARLLVSESVIILQEPKIGKL